MKILKGVNPLDLVYDQFRQLRERFRTAGDAQERKVLLRRLVNIVGVIQFLLTINRSS